MSALCVYRANVPTPTSVQIDKEGIQIVKLVNVAQKTATAIWFIVILKVHPVYPLVLVARM
jgi:hypothetical protein